MVLFALREKTPLFLSCYICLSTFQDFVGSPVKVEMAGMWLLQENSNDITQTEPPQPYPFGLIRFDTVVLY